ncbi:MAG: hypothetical protein OEY64_00515 [Nitrospinota bacterium]|nr:hypothetical protein [Nitrospinota bacterium]
MKKIFSWVTIVSLVGLSVCSNSFISAFDGPAAISPHTSAHHHGMPEDSSENMLGHSMECCAVVSSGLILPDNLSVSVYFAIVFFVLVYRFIVPPRILLPVYHPPRP